MTNALCEHSRACRALRFFCEQLQKFGEHQQASTRLNLASKSSKGKIFRAVKNFNGPFITPTPMTKLCCNQTKFYIYSTLDFYRHPEQNHLYYKSKVKEYFPCNTNVPVSVGSFFVFVKIISDKSRLKTFKTFLKLPLLD